MNLVAILQTSTGTLKTIERQHQVQSSHMKTTIQRAANHVHPIAMFFAPVGVLFIMCGVCSSSPQLAGLFHTKVFTQGYITSCQNYPRLLDHGTSQEKLTPIHCTTDNCTCISQNYLHSYFVGQYCTCLYIYKNKKH